MKPTSHPTDEELLRHLDGDTELPERGIAGHLAMCIVCRRRLDDYSRVTAFAGQRSDAPDFGEAAARRRRLVARLSDTPDRSAFRVAAPSMVVRVVAAAVAFALVGLSVSWWRTVPSSYRSISLRSRDEDGARPNRSLTPGAARLVPLAELCQAMPLEPQPVTGPVRAQVLHDYGMESVPAHEYELDYLITPDLGGVPDRRNLWPERYRSLVWNARVKDELEDLLARMVCEGRIDLATAQREIATDWIAAYRKYFRTDHPVRLYSALMSDREARP